MSRLTVRATPRSDAALVADLARRHNEHWSGAPAGWLSAGFVESAYDMPGMDPANDFSSVYLDGRYVGGSAVFHQEPYSEISVYKFMDVELSEEEAKLVGRAIIEHAAAAAQLYADRAPGDVQSHLVLSNWPGEPFVDISREEGFAYARSNFVMRRPVSADEPPVEAPEGVRVRPIDMEADSADVAYVMTAFEDHHGDQVFSEAQLRHFMQEPDARPDLSSIAYDDIGPVSAALCSVGADGGSVGILATVRRARGRGIASTLLHTSFASLAGAGCHVVRLNVDAENTTGALGVYERAGMARESEVELWMRPIPRTV